MACNQMKTQNKFGDFDVSNMQECEQKMGSIIETIVGTIFLLMIII